MGYYTELLFNEVRLIQGALRPLRESAISMINNKECKFGYMLNYIYIESAGGHDYGTIDLQASEAMGRELKKRGGTLPLAWSEVGAGAPVAQDEEEADDIFWLEWDPYDGYSGKWYHAVEFAAWVSTFCASGQLFELTQENDGGLWGWEFRDGMFRELELRPKGRWRRSRPANTIKPRAQRRA